MAETQVITDPAPFLASTGVTIGVDGKATVVGAVTLFSKKFDMKRMSSFSFNAQGTGSGVAAAGTNPATAWRVFACNDYDPTRPAQSPGTFVDVTADFGAAGVVVAPGTKQFNAAAFSGAVSDRMAAWCCPYAFIQFQLPQQSGTEVVSGQFFASEV
jgi:hypothetical protein